jgi:hypothetical protein
MTGNDNDEEHPGAARIMAGIESLHDRLDALEAAGRRELGAASGFAVRSVPAWRRETEGEARWQVALATAVAIALQLPVPGRLDLVRPAWVLPAVQGALLVALVVANPHRINRESTALRMLSLTLAALLSFANAWAAAELVSQLVHGEGTGASAVLDRPAALLVTGGAIWLTNVIVFALWYWEFDQGGPVARALGTAKRPPDFLFPQMTLTDDPHLVPKDWEAAFTDYLYLAFTNATAFSPTDTMPLSRWAKMAMTLQSAVSLVTAALVIARAVNIFR